MFETEEYVKLKECPKLFVKFKVLFSFISCYSLKKDFPFQIIVVSVSKIISVWKNILKGRNNWQQKNYFKTEKKNSKLNRTENKDVKLEQMLMNKCFQVSSFKIIFQFQMFFFLLDKVYGPNFAPS